MDKVSLVFEIIDSTKNQLAFESSVTLLIVFRKLLLILVHLMPFQLISRTSQRRSVTLEVHALGLRLTEAWSVHLVKDVLINYNTFMAKTWGARNGLQTNPKIPLKPSRSWSAGENKQKLQSQMADQHRKRVESLTKTIPYKAQPRLRAASVDLSDRNKLVHAIYSVDIGADFEAIASKNAPPNSSPQTTSLAPAPRIASPNTARQKAPVKTATQNTQPAVAYE